MNLKVEFEIACALNSLRHGPVSKVEVQRRAVKAMRFRRQDVALLTVEGSEVSSTGTMGFRPISGDGGLEISAKRS